MASILVEDCRCESIALQSNFDIDVRQCKLLDDSQYRMTDQKKEHQKVDYCNKAQIRCFHCKRQLPLLKYPRKDEPEARDLHERSLHCMP